MIPKPHLGWLRACMRLLTAVKSLSISASEHRPSAPEISAEADIVLEERPLKRLGVYIHPQVLYQSWRRRLRTAGLVAQAGEMSFLF